MSSFGSDTPFMLLAKLKVKEDKVAEYLEIADKTDKAIEADEPGMLHHTFDQDPDDPLRFVWSEVYKNDDFKNWTNEWEKRLKLNNSSDKYLELMKKTNPIVIPRNQKVEEALADADKGNLETMNKLLKVLSNPYSDQENIIEFQKPTPIGNEKYQTFCGT